MHSDASIEPFNNIAIETAGFMCPPLIFPVMYITPASVRPITSQCPVKRMDVTSKKVPIHSEIIARNFIYYRQIFNLRTLPTGGFLN